MPEDRSRRSIDGFVLQATRLGDRTLNRYFSESKQAKEERKDRKREKERKREERKQDDRKRKGTRLNIMKLQTARKQAERGTVQVQCRC